MIATIKLQNFRGCRSAVLRVQHAKTLLIAGRNEAGKSETYKGCCALLMGNRRPDGGDINKSGEFITRGEKFAVGHICTAADDRRITWMPTDAQLEGGGPTISRVAAGLDSLSEMTPDKRIKLLAELLEADPTDEDFQLECVDVLGWEVTDKRIAEHLKVINASGWETAQKKVNEDSTYKQRRFAEVTGKKWSVKALSEYGIAHAGEFSNTDTVEELGAAVKKAEHGLEEALKAEARRVVAGDELAEKAAQVEKLEGEAAALKDQITMDGQNLTTAKALLGELEKQVKASSPMVQHGSQPCPGCDTPLMVINGVIQKWVKVESGNAVQAQELEAQVTAQRTRVHGLESGLADLEGQYRVVNRSLTEATDAARQRAQLAAQPKGADGSDGLSVADARMLLASAQTKRDALVRWTEAVTLDAAVVQCRKLEDSMAPTGLRQAVLTQYLEEFNDKHLRPLCVVSGWRALTIEPDGAIHYGGTPFVDQSESAQYRINAMLQLAVAQYEQGESPMVMFDSPECLDRKGKIEFLTLLAKSKATAIVFMVANEIGDVPDLGAMKCGETAWIENGVVASKELSAV